jgi:hypothetical protein
MVPGNDSENMKHWKPNESNQIETSGPGYWSFIKLQVLGSEADEMYAGRTGYNG